jgi:hypothetical protein
MIPRSLIALPALLLVACFQLGHLPPPSAKTIDGGAEVDKKYLDEVTASVHALQPRLEPCKNDDCLCTVLCDVKTSAPPQGKPVEVSFPGHLSGVGIQIDAQGKAMKCFHMADDGESEIDDCPWVTY